MIATSAGVVARTVKPSFEAPPGPAAWIWPKAPKMTFLSERFIARHIISVSNEPEEPTSIPLTIRTSWRSSKPAAEAEIPVQALSREITTGMSAPPIGSTNRTPKASAAAISIKSSEMS